jgi:hypothetical protein
MPITHQKEGHIMNAGWIGRAIAAVSLLALAGCGGDVATQIKTDAPVRDRAMDTFASNAVLAKQMTQRLLTVDSLRAGVIETMLHDKTSAQYVLVRIGSNPDAVDLVLQVAAADSAGREHVMTLLKGMQLALKSGKKH